MSKQFGDMFFIKRIPTEKWVPFIVNRFADSGKTILPELAQKICDVVDNYLQKRDAILPTLYLNAGLCPK